MECVSYVSFGRKFRNFTILHVKFYTTPVFTCPNAPVNTRDPPTVYRYETLLLTRILLSFCKTWTTVERTTRLGGVGKYTPYSPLHWTRVPLYPHLLQHCTTDRRIHVNHYFGTVNAEYRSHIMTYVIQGVVRARIVFVQTTRIRVSENNVQLSYHYFLCARWTFDASQIAMYSCTHGINAFRTRATDFHACFEHFSNWTLFNDDLFVDFVLYFTGRKRV